VNSIRPVAVASLRVKGEAQDARSARTRRIVTGVSVGKSADRKRQIAQRNGKGWLETEWTEGAIQDTGIPVHDKLCRLETFGGCGRTTCQPSGLRCRVGHCQRYEAADATSRYGPWTEVRASIVAWKPGNAGGAKGRREMNV
jgi:hypothetical protein